MNRNGRHETISTVSRREGLRTLVLAPVFTLACTSAAPPREAPPAKLSDSPEAQAIEPAVASKDTSALETLRGKVEIDEKPGGKKFQGVWLIDDEDVRHVISYRADPWWQAFDGLEVEASGHAYTPRGQAITAAHFRVEELRVVEPGPDDPLVSISGELELTGTFAGYTWPEGTKLGGETVTVFRTDGGSQYWLSRVPEPAPALDVPMRITTREVEPSPFVARPGGPHLWVIEAKPARSPR